ncbi:hypothetical protein GWI33_010742, partial [Rhynchophorus ferrugineus]
ASTSKRLMPIGVRSQNGILLYNSSINSTEPSIMPELFYRHSAAMTAVYCVAYILVFAVGLVGNFFVIAVVYRSPRMRTVTNFFIVNLAVADILVIVFCLPATLMSNIFVQIFYDDHNMFKADIDNLLVHNDISVCASKCVFVNDSMENL